MPGSLGSSLSADRQLPLVLEPLEVAERCIGRWAPGRRDVEAVNGIKPPIQDDTHANRYVHPIAPRCLFWLGELHALTVCLPGFARGVR